MHGAADAELDTFDGSFQGPDANIRGQKPHTPEYVAAAILRLLRTGKERQDLLPHPADWSPTELPD